MWDAIIIGGGLAGLIAGIRAQERGKAVLLISEGVGSLVYSAGAWDIGDIRKLQNQSGHPYSWLGERRIRDGFDYFLRLYPEYDGEWGVQRTVLTPFGDLRNADICAPELQADCLNYTDRIVLVVPHNLKDFFPELVCENLRKQFPGNEVITYKFKPPEFEDHAGRSITEVDYARFWTTDRGHRELARILAELSADLPVNPSQSGPGTHHRMAVIIPGLAAEFDQGLTRIIKNSPFPVLQMTAFPPAAGGKNLQESLVGKFKQAGGEFLSGSSVVGAILQDGHCAEVFVQSKGRQSSFQAQTYVLAGGGILGGAIEVTPQGARERVFDLPLFVPGQWSTAEFLAEQPYARIGIEVDQFLRPLDPERGGIVVNNIMVAGRMLAHWDPWVDKCGAGVSLATGYRAGQLI